MATSLTRNLKLRLNSNLTADSKYNLERIDLLGATFLVDSTNTLNIRSSSNINIEPDSADLGGNSTGGTLSIGSGSHSLESFQVYTDAFLLDSSLSLKDQASSGTKYLAVRYKSDITGSVDTSADRILSLDLEGADRSIILGGDLTFSGGSLTLALSGNTSLTLPLSGTVSTLSGTETLTNKSIDAAANTLTNISNSSISTSAGISYSKLDLSSSITNSDVSASAAISYNKLALTGSILGTDINSSAAIAYSKLNLSSSIINADISSSAAIAYSKLNLAGSITNADIAPGFALDGTNVDPAFGNQIVSTEDRFRLISGGLNTDIQPASSGQSTDLLFHLPSGYGVSGQVLGTDGAGNLAWQSPTSGSVAQVAATWLTADGTTKVVSHGLGTDEIDVTIIDLDTSEIISVSSIVATDSNTVTLTASEAPATSWRIIIQG